MPLLYVRHTESNKEMVGTVIAPARIQSLVLLVYLVAY